MGNFFNNIFSLVFFFDKSTVTTIAEIPMHLGCNFPIARGQLLCRNYILSLIPANPLLSCRESQLTGNLKRYTLAYVSDVRMYASVFYVLV